MISCTYKIYRWYIGTFELKDAYFLCLRFQLIPKICYGPSLISPVSTNNTDVAAIVQNAPQHILKAFACRKTRALITVRAAEQYTSLINSSSNHCPINHHQSFSFNPHSDPAKHLQTFVIFAHFNKFFSVSTQCHFLI